MADALPPFKQADSGVFDVPSGGKGVVGRCQVRLRNLLDAARGWDVETRMWTYPRLVGAVDGYAACSKFSGDWYPSAECRRTRL